MITLNVCQLSCIEFRIIYNSRKNEFIFVDLLPNNKDSSQNIDHAICMYMIQVTAKTRNPRLVLTSQYYSLHNPLSSKPILTN